MSDKPRKFQLGDVQDEEDLIRAVRKDNPVLRVRRSCEIRIRNHIAEIKKLTFRIDEARDEIRHINAMPKEDLPARLTQDIRRDILGISIKDMIKWRKHLRTDIKFLNNQRNILEKEE